MDKYLNKIRSIVDQNGIQRKRIDESVEDTLMLNLLEAVADDVESQEESPANPPKIAKSKSSKDGISNAKASEFFARARSLATITHFAHLSTDSFSEHSALNTFYEEIVESIDTFCEAYIGLYGKFISLPKIPTQIQIAVDAIIDFREWIAENRNLITDDSSLQNLIDSTVELCNTTIYKLQKLK